MDPPEDVRVQAGLQFIERTIIGRSDDVRGRYYVLLEDVLDGRVSPEAARRDYGVVIDAGTVDAAATAAARAWTR